MSSQDDKDSLLGLFSTRATQNKPLDRSSMLPAATQNPGKPSVVPAPRSGATAAPSVSTRQSSTNISSQQHQTRSKLSPLASTVLREARRELGSDHSLQQVQDAGALVAEASIAGAVDKVLKRRNEAIDDIERANIIIHLQKDLMGWGVLQPLIDNREVTDIHEYHNQTVV
jgi:hypothetical protein